MRSHTSSSHTSRRRRPARLPSSASTTRYAGSLLVGARCVARCFACAGIDFLRSRDQTYRQERQHHRTSISAVVWPMAEPSCAVCWWYTGVTKEVKYDDSDGGHSPGKKHRNAVASYKDGHFPEIDLPLDGAFVWTSDVIAAAADAGLELQHVGEEMIPGPPPGGPSLGAVRCAWQRCATSCICALGGLSHRTPPPGGFG